MRLGPIGGRDTVRRLTFLCRVTVLVLLVAVIGGLGPLTPTLGHARTGEHSAALAVRATSEADRTPLVGVWTGAPSAAQAAILDDLGVGWARVPIGWDAVEPSDNAYEWGALDRAIDGASRDGHRQVVAVVRNNPNWAAASRCRISSAAERDRLADFMSVLTTRYRGRIHSWMLYNEPDNTSVEFDTQHNLGGCFGTLRGQGATQEGRDDYAAMIEVVGRAIQEADRDARVLMGGIASANFTDQAGPGCPLASACLFDREFARGVLSALKARGALDRLDGVAVHYFSSQAPLWASPGTPDLLGRVEGLRRDMAAAGLGPDELKSILVEEGSYTGLPPGQATSAQSTADPQSPFNQAQRDYLVKAVARAAAADLLAFFWFWLQDSRSGLGSDNAYGLLTAGGDQKPSYMAVRYVTALIDRADRLDGRAALASSKLEGYDFVAPDGRRFQIVWNEEDQETVSHSPPGTISAVTDPIGAAVPFSGNAVQVGAEPRFVFYDGTTGLSASATPQSSGAAPPRRSATDGSRTGSGSQTIVSGPTSRRVAEARTFGMPISRELQLLGFRVQFFQGHILQLMGMAGSR